MATLEEKAVKLSIRLGTYPLWVLTVPDYMNMWEACRYQADLFFVYNQWCTIWTEEDVDDLAYQEDLEFYWDKGYGYDIDWQMAVELFGSITDNIVSSLMKMKDFQSQCSNLTKHSRRRGISQKRSLRDDAVTSCETQVQNIPYQLTGSFRFGHAETVAPALAWLGLYYTSPSLMMWNTPRQSRANRAWKTSIITPYSTNLNFLVYACPASQGSHVYNKALIKVLHNEREVWLPGCNGDLYCSFNSWLAYSSGKLNIDFDQLCDASS